MKYCNQCRRAFPEDLRTCPDDQAILQAVQECPPGMILRNKYEILGKIGEGGMACVYSARHLVFNEVCAIKLVNDDLAADASFLRRFETEALITRKLHHTSAVRVEDFDLAEDGRPFIVMELVEGRNLRDVIREERSLACQRAVAITRQIAEALAVAHKLGIVHRDIKPDNIVLTQDGNGQEKVKVLDFGIAKLRVAAEAQRTNLTVTGMLIGTPLSMSPEQFLGNKTPEGIDGRADIYALGVLLFQILTGEPPFHADTAYGLMLQHLEAPVQSPRALRPDLDIPEKVCAVVLKCMEKDRACRFQSAEELITALDQAMSWNPGLEKAVEPASGIAPGRNSPNLEPSGATGSKPTVAKPVRNTRPILVACGVLVLVLLLSAAYFVRHSAGQKSTVVLPSIPAASPGQTDVPRLLAIGRQSLDVGEYSQAIATFQQALSISPADADVRATLERAIRAHQTEEELLRSRR